MTRRRNADSLAMQRRRVKNFRRSMEDGGWKRKEIWVPADMTREESAILQDWIEEILADIRRAPPAETAD